MNSIKNKKVLLLTDIYAPYKEPLLAEIAKHTDLTVYYTKDVIPIRQWNVEFSNKYKYEILKGRYLNIKHFHLFFNPIIVKKLLKERFDVVIVGGYSYPTVQLALIISKLVGSKIIMWSGTTENEKHRLRFLFYPLKKLFISLADRYVTYSTNAKKYLMKFGVKQDLIDVAPITVNIEKFLNKNKKINNDIKKIIFVGRLEDIKRVTDLISMMELLRDKNVILNIIGEGTLEEELNNRIKQHGLQDDVFLLGHLSQDELKEYYHNSDIFILPSSYEPSGNVINEAMASGLPTITTNIIGNDAVEHGKTGFVVNVGDYKKMAEYAVRIIEDDVLAKEISAYNISRIENYFSIQYEASQFAKSIEKLYRV